MLTSSDIFVGIEVIPATLLWEVDAAIASLIVAYRTSHQRRTEHPLVADILHCLITIEVHHQRAHQRVVLEMSPACHRIKVWHQAIAQLVVIDE